MTRIAVAIIAVAVSLTGTPALAKDKNDKATTVSNETMVNRVKTSDKQQKAVLDFIKG